MIIKRSAYVAFPQTWSNFQRNHDGKVYKFMIREAVLNEKEYLSQFMCKHFMIEETCNAAFGFNKYPEAMEEFQQYIDFLIKNGHNAICFDVTDEANHKIAAANLMVHEDEEPVMEEYKSQPMKNLMKLFDLMQNAKNIFEAYNVTNVLHGAGMFTIPEYRSMGLATELILARDQLCNAFEIPLSSAAFTGIASQRVAIKCGYKSTAKLEYKELGRIYGIDFNTKAEHIEIMAKLQ